MKIAIDQKNAQNVGDAMRQISEIAAQSGFDEAKLRAIETLSTLQVDFESGVPEETLRFAKASLDVFRGRALAALGTLKRSGKTVVAITGDEERAAKINVFVERILNEFNDLSGETVGRIAQSMQDVFPPDSLETPWDVDAKTPEFCAALQRHGVADEDAPSLAERAIRVVTAAAKEIFWDAKKDDAEESKDAEKAKALEIVSAFQKHADALVNIPPGLFRTAVDEFACICDGKKLRSITPDELDAKIAELVERLQKKGFSKEEAERVAPKTVAALQEIGQAVSDAVEGASE